jgi:hypothetical protein
LPLVKLTIFDCSKTQEFISEEVPMLSPTVATRALLTSTATALHLSNKRENKKINLEYRSPKKRNNTTISWLAIAYLTNMLSAH